MVVLLALRAIGGSGKGKGRGATTTRGRTV
jgi:hypothetical protein